MIAGRNRVSCFRDLDGNVNICMYSPVRDVKERVN